MEALWGWLQIGIAIILMALCSVLIYAWIIAERRMRRRLRDQNERK